MNESIEIRVRYRNGTYIASGGGKQASCGMSAHEAAERLAQKLADGRIWSIEATGPEKYRLTIMEEE